MQTVESTDSALTQPQFRHPRTFRESQNLEPVQESVQEQHFPSTRKRFTILVKNIENHYISDICIHNNHWSIFL